MNPMKLPRTIILTVLCLFAGTASAHTGVHGTLTGFAGGLAHPLLGLDHLLGLPGLVGLLYIWFDIEPALPRSK